MADFRRSVLGLFQQGVDAVNNAVMHVSTVTRNKMDELSLQNQRRELMETLANTVYTQWQQGETYPESLTSILKQIKEVNDQLDTLAKQAEKPAEEPVTDAAKEPVAEAADETEKPEVTVEPAQEAEVPAPVKEEEPVPTIEVKEETPAWLETPVTEAPQITVQEEAPSEE